MYAGRPGTPFIIKKAFKTVEEMKEEFKDGDSSDVWFGEYCIIDTVNKNDRTNGSIYQRGPNYAKDGDARYIGRIVGPASGTPSFSFTNLWAIEEWIKKTPVSSKVKHTFPIKPNGKLHYDVDDGCSIADEYGNIDAKQLEVFSLSRGSGIVPGKKTDEDGNVTYNDDIKYTWVNIAYPEDDNRPTVTHVGFQIPYTVFTFDGTVKPPYDANGNYNSTVDFNGGVETTNGIEHPYAYKYTLKVPSGVTGVCVKTIGVYKVSEIKADAATYGVTSNKIYSLSDLTVDNQGHLTGKTKSYTLPSGDEVCDDPQVILVELVSYANKRNGESVWAYISDYDVLDDMSIQDDGTIVKSYTHRADKSFDRRIKWVDSFRIMDDGSILVDYNTGARDNFLKLLKWIDSLNVTDDGDLVIKFNTDHGEKRFQLNWVKSISLSEDKGGGLLDDKHLKTTTVKGQTASIGDPINYILDVYLTSDYHLMLLYNDKTHRGDPAADGNTKIDDNSFEDSLGRIWVRKVHEIDGVLTRSDTKAWDEVYWQDMGAIKDKSGLLIGKRITSDASKDDILASLNEDYSEGYEGGKIITVGPSGESQNFFAYDYDEHKWYYLGNLNKDNLDLAPENTPSNKMKSTGYYVLTGEPAAAKTFTKFWDKWVTNS